MHAMKILTARQMRRIDERTEREHGVAADTLMDNAGRRVAEALLGIYPALSSMNPLILCGKGNNGGDGITAARHLRSFGVMSRVVLLASPGALEGIAAAHMLRARDAGVTIESVPDEAAWKEVAGTLDDHALIVDAVLGTGLQGGARGLAARVIDSMRDASGEKVSLDIPSGLSGDSAEIPGPALRADHTIALACPKIPHVFPPATALVGRLHVVDIGIPPEAIDEESVDLNLVTEDEAAALIPIREADSHKGDFGRVLVVGGSTGKSGAAAMVALSALRSGAGLVTAATGATAQKILAGQVMEMMTEALPETPEGSLSAAAAPVLEGLSKQADVLAVGPGLTAREETSALVRDLVSRTSLPVVLDADGLNAFAGRATELDGGSRVLILTPHPGEMARLLSAPGAKPMTAADVQSDRVALARSFAVDHGCYLVLKGYLTVVAGPDGQAWINPTGNPGMATGGSGDVLTGVLAGLLAQGLSPLDACLAGVYAHGLAGDLASADHGETSLIAGDIIEFLPEAFLQLERAAE